MIILGVCNANDSGAGLIIDGKLVASINEERLTRIKGHRVFPKKSIEFCLDFAGISVSDVNYVACGAWGGISHEFLPQCVENIIQRSVGDEAKKLIIERSRVAVERDVQFKKELITGLEEMGFSFQHISCYDHHLSHAATAFYPSPFEEALIVTVDGRGDFRSASIYLGTRNQGLEHLDSTSMFDSLGAFYGFITRFLGFVPDRHEGKITGLAALGNPNVCIDLLREMIDIKEGKIVANIGEKYTPFLAGELPYIEEKLKDFSKEDVAAAAQFLLEDIVLKYIRPYLEKTKMRNVALAGGVFGNVKLNERILEMDLVDNVYVFPNMGDGGNAVGGALLKLYETGGKFDYPLKHVYLGPEYDDEQIRIVLEKYKENICWTSLSEYTLDKVAEDLITGSIIGLFIGRMEYGPRALGARSIIASAVRHDINDSLNKRLNRTEFMPFAPVTLKDYATNCFVGWKSEHLAAEFMTVCYPCTDVFIEQSPATAHVDNTARPQIIDGKYNSLYFDIVKKYYEATGIPTLVNTSFNNHEEPIVCSPEDAIKSLLLGNVDYLIFEKYVVSTND